MIGATVQLTFSLVWMSELARVELLLVDEVRQARVDGRAERSRSQALRSPPGQRSVRGPARTATCRRRRPERGRRRSSGRAVKPGRAAGRERAPPTTAGRNSAIIRALTHEPELVRSLTSTTSATVASSVPRLEPSVARNRRRKPGAVPRRLNWRRNPVTAAESVRKPLRPFSRRASASARNAWSSGVPTVMRIALGAPNPASGRTITPSRSSASNHGCASSPRSTNTKFPTGRCGHPVARVRQDPLELGTTLGIRPSPALDFTGRIHAGERRDLRRSRRGRTPAASFLAQ